MVSKYGEDEWGWDPKSVSRYRLSGLWGVISTFGDVSNARGFVFYKGICFKVGKGDKVRFWLDD